jgi:two-component system sensor histidine kinase PilS (NtrC family)
VTPALQRYSLLRLCLTLGVLAWTLGIVAAGGWADIGAVPFLRVCAAALVVVVAATLWMQRRPVADRFLLGQLAVDVSLASVLSAYTGGRHSFFIFLYFPAIAAGAYLLRMRGSLLTAGMAALGFLAMLAINGELGSPTAHGSLVLYSETMFRLFAFVLLALLTGQLGETVARVDQRLQQERRTTAVLAMEHGTVLERVKAGVLTTDVEGRVAQVNPFGRALLGEVVGRPLDEVFAGRSARTAAGGWEETRPDGQRWACTEAGLPGGGRVVLVDDITELQRMRESVARDERLVAAGRLAASMAHEIRNPLASLSGSLQLIREEHPSRLADLALSEAGRLNRLVEDFLDVARRPRIVPIEVDVHTVVADVCEAFARDARYQGKVTATCAGVPSVAKVDADRVRQALWNLVINGAQAMPRGGTVHVDVRPRHDDAIEIRVTDQGVGIPAADRDRVFDPFYTTRSGGTGLGLAVVEQVTRAHGGTIRVDGRSSGGTEFVLAFPREAQVIDG